MALKSAQALHGIELCLRMPVTRKQKFAQVMVGGAALPDTLANCLNYRYHLSSPKNITGTFVMANDFGTIADRVVGLGGHV
jgi:hypothetical protein